MIRRLHTKNNAHLIKRLLQHMTPDEYVVAVEAAAKALAIGSCCMNTWRIQLSNLTTPIGSRYYPDRCSCRSSATSEDGKCDKCVRCVRCNWFWDPETQPRSIHSNLGNYDDMPEVYIAASLTKPWLNPREYKPYMHDLLNGKGTPSNCRSQPECSCYSCRKDETYMAMTADEIVAGLHAIRAKWPNIVGWTHYETMYVATIARMPSVIALVTEWMERRMDWFTPAGPYNWLTRTLELKDTLDICYRRLDLPPLAKVGPCNLPTYINSMDWSSSTMNAMHAIDDWVGKSTSPWDNSTIQILGRSVAANPEQWGAIECASMNGYKAIPYIVGCICHAIDIDESKSRTALPSKSTGCGTPMGNHEQRLVWHTTRTRCVRCPTKCDSEYHGLYCDCLPEVATEPLAMTPYECIIAAAVCVRRRKLRGVFWCAMVLLGKARHMHFRPGIGSEFKRAAADYANITTPTAEHAS